MKRRNIQQTIDDCITAVKDAGIAGLSTKEAGAAVGLDSRSHAARALGMAAVSGHIVSRRDLDRRHAGPRVGRGLRWYASEYDSRLPERTPRNSGVAEHLRSHFLQVPDEELSYDDMAVMFGVSKQRCWDAVKAMRANGEPLESVTVVRLSAEARRRLMQRAAA